MNHNKDKDKKLSNDNNEKMHFSDVPPPTTTSKPTTIAGMADIGEAMELQVFGKISLVFDVLHMLLSLFYGIAHLRRFHGLHVSTKHDWYGGGYQRANG